MERLLFAVSGRGWEHKLAVRVRRKLPKVFEEFHWGWNLTIFPPLRVEPRFGFAVTRTVRNSKFTSLQFRYITSCSRKPLTRNVANKARSAWEHAAKKVGKLFVAVDLHQRGDALGYR
jgi:hypothetical protein